MNSKSWIALFCGLLLLVGCSGEKKADDVKGTEPTQTNTSPPTTKLTYEDIKPGAGPGSEEGDLLMVQYTGTLKKDGTAFDSNLDPGKAPLPVRLGQGRVIKGWEEGLLGMKKGGTRKLHVPSALAYGADGFPPKIGPNEDLEFEVTVLDRVGKDEEGVYDKKDVKVGTGKTATNGMVCEVHYTGTLVNGKKFDSSKDSGKPLSLTLGAGQVIKGWDAGLVGMKEGGIRELRIPPAIGYGAQGSGEGIPGEQVLLFTVEMLKVTPAPVGSPMNKAPGQPGGR